MPVRHPPLPIALAGLLLLAGSSAALSQPAPRIDCAKAQSTVEINACAEKELEAADKRLNAAYQAALARIDRRDDMTAEVRAEWRKAVRDAQRAWIAFRDADCKGPVAFEWYGGTGATAAVLGCMIEKTTARTKDLAPKE